MKKVLLITLFLTSFSFAQNLQMFYDIGKDDNGNKREYFTTTLEMFKPDKYGATFFFVDFDYNQPGNKSASLGYWEIARYISLPGVKGLSATVQYNDGVAPWGPLGNVWLAGLSYPIDLGVITLNTDVLLRRDYLVGGTDAQLTVVWFKTFFNNKVQFNGFLDIWSADDPVEDGKRAVVLTEPQLWYNVSDQLAVGSELEISKNFLPTDAWEYMPTFGLKWNF